MRRLLNDPRVVSLLVVIALFVVAWRWYAYLNPRRPTARVKPPPAVAGEKVPAPPAPATPPGPALPAGEAGPPPAATPEGPPAPTIQKLSLPIFDLVVTDRDPFSVAPPTPLEEGFPVEPRIPPPPGGPSPPQQPSSPPPLPPLPDIRLKMVMFADGRKKAVVELDGAEWILEEGDKFGKEQVASIEEEAIVLTSTTYGVRAIRLPGMVFEAQGRSESRPALTPSRTPTAPPSFPRPVEKEIQPPEVAGQEMPQEGVGRE